MNTKTLATELQGQLVDSIDSTHPWKLLYRMSADGPSCYTFHKLCDDKGPTLTVVRCRLADEAEYVTTPPIPAASSSFGRSCRLGRLMSALP